MVDVYLKYRPPNNGKKCPENPIKGGVKF